MIRVNCPGCGQVYDVPEDAAGKSSKCRQCAATINIPKRNAPVAELVQLSEPAKPWFYSPILVVGVLTASLVLGLAAFAFLFAALTRRPPPIP